MGTPAALRALTTLAAQTAAAAAGMPGAGRAEESAATGVAGSGASALLLRESALFVADWLTCFGLSFSQMHLTRLRQQLAWPATLLRAQGTASAGLADMQTDSGADVFTTPPAHATIPATHVDYSGEDPPAAVRELVSFRAAVRAEAMGLLKAAKQASKQSKAQPSHTGEAPEAGDAASAARLMALCDRVRDRTLPSLGWAIADGRGPTDAVSSIERVAIPQAAAHHPSKPSS